MVTVNNDDLRLVYHYLATISNVIQKEVRTVNGNKSHLDKMVPEELSRLYSNKEKSALSFIDGITRLSYENSVVGLCAAFERIVFAKYRTTYGELRKLTIEQTSKPLDFYDSRVRFINDSIDKLSGIIHLIDGIIDEDLIAKLKIIKDHRNYIAHGKRDSMPPVIEFSLDAMAAIFDDVILEIEK